MIRPALHSRMAAGFSDPATGVAAALIDEVERRGADLLIRAAPEACPRHHTRSTYTLIGSLVAFAPRRCCWSGRVFSLNSP